MGGLWSASNLMAWPTQAVPSTAETSSLPQNWRPLAGLASPRELSRAKPGSFQSLFNVEDKHFIREDKLPEPGPRTSFSFTPILLSLVWPTLQILSPLHVPSRSPGQWFPFLPNVPLPVHGLPICPRSSQSACRYGSRRKGCGGLLPIP